MGWLSFFILTPQGRRLARQRPPSHVRSQKMQQTTLQNSEKLVFFLIFRRGVLKFRIRDGDKKEYSSYLAGTLEQEGRRKQSILYRSRATSRGHEVASHAGFLESNNSLFVASEVKISTSGDKLLAIHKLQKATLLSAILVRE